MALVGLGLSAPPAKYTTLPNLRSTQVGRWHGQRRQRVDLQRARLPLQQIDFVVVRFGVGAAGADQAAIRLDRGPISPQSRQAAGHAPRGLARQQRIDRVVPEFRALFPRRLVREIRAPRNQQRVAAGSGKRSSQASRVRERWQLCPLGRVPRLWAGRGRANQPTRHNTIAGLKTLRDTLGLLARDGFLAARHCQAIMPH